MGVKLREKKLSGGGVSFYLDINHNGQRRYEFLSIQAKGNRRSAEFIEKKQLAEKARTLKEYEITVLKTGIPDERKTESDFFSFAEREFDHSRSKEPYKYTCNMIRKYCGSTILPANDITKEFAIGFIRFLGTRDLEGSTIFTHVNRFSTLINRAIDDGIMSVNPFKQLPRSQRVKYTQKLPKFLTLDQLEHLAQQSGRIPAQLRLAFFFSCFTGIRWGDCSRLRWKQITSQIIDKKKVYYLTLEQQKTEAPVMLPISGAALLVLNERETQHAKELATPLKSSSTKELELRKLSQEYIFPRLYEPKGKRTKQRYYAKRMNKWGEQANMERLHFHLSRHTFATLTLSEGAEIYTVSKLLGQKSIQHTQRYAQVVDRLKIDAVSNLPGLSAKSLKQPEKPARKKKSN
jgi:integrase/recombinase XerD